jgi:hypothetical protein
MHAWTIKSQCHSDIRCTSAVPWLSLLPCTQFIFNFNKLMIDQLTFQAIFIIFVKLYFETSLNSLSNILG